MSADAALLDRLSVWSAPLHFLVVVLPTIQAGALSPAGVESIQGGEAGVGPSRRIGYIGHGAEEPAIQIDQKLVVVRGWFRHAPHLTCYIFGT